MFTQLAFKGDYSREFGGGKPRVWRAFRVFDQDNKEIGSIYEEPEYHHLRYRAFLGGFETSGDYVGQYPTKRQALASFRK